MTNVSKTRDRLRGMLDSKLVRRFRKGIDNDNTMGRPSKRTERNGGPYCDYAAWCEWFEAFNEQQPESIQIDTDAIDKTALYLVFCSACSYTPVNRRLIMH